VKRIWLISKYCRLPGDGFYPARGFSLLREMARRGHDCTLITARHDWSVAGSRAIPGREVKMVDGVRVVTLNVLGYRRAKSLRRILGWLHFEARLFSMQLKDLPRPDAIIASSLSLLSVINGLILKRRFRSLLVFEVRDIWPLILTENGGLSRLNPFVRALGLVEWLGYKCSDRIVGTMPNLREHVRKILGYDREVFCIPMGVPVEMIADRSDLFPVRLDAVFPRTDFVLTYAGSIGIDNALDTLVLAARQLQRNPRISFFIIGSGDLLRRYKSDCQDLTNVVFADPVPNKSLQPVLRRSSALYFAAHPTVVLEYGQSLNKIIDYMYSGRPIIGSYSGFPSMVDESGCGEFVPAGNPDALVAKINEWVSLPPERLTEYGARGRSWLLKNRTYSSLAEQYLRIFGDL